MSGAEAQSKTTTFAGLPKAIKLRSATPLVTPTINTWTAMLFDTVVFNYGGFITHGSAGALDGIIVPEPGVYSVEGTIGYQVMGSNTSVNVQLFINGSVAVLPDGTNCMTGTNNLAGGISSAWRVNTLTEMKAGDYIGVWTFNNVGGVACRSDNAELVVHKLPGQY